MPATGHAEGRFRIYSGLIYLLVTILVSIAGNILFQTLLFPIFPYPIFVSLVSAMFPALFVIVAFRQRYSRALWIKYARLAPFMLLNSLMSGILFNWSLLLTSMSAVTVITSLSTLFTLMFSKILLKIPIQMATLVSIHLSIVGSILVVFSSSDSPNALVGDLSLVTDDSSESYGNHVLGCTLALVSSACSGLTSVLLQKFDITHSDLYLSISGISAILYFGIFLVLNALFHLEHVSFGTAEREVWTLLAINGIMSSIIGYYFYIKALSRLSSLTVNVLWSVSIPLAVMVDYYRGLIRSITPTFLVGALIVLFSTVLVPVEQQDADQGETTRVVEEPSEIEPHTSLHTQ